MRMESQLITFATSQGYELTGGDLWARPETVCRCPHCGKDFVHKNTEHSRNSYHYRRLAIDLNLFRDARWLTDTADHAPLGLYWESLGGTWGGRFKKPDGNHYSYLEGGG